jgi:hypothetical protein
MTTFQQRMRRLLEGGRNKAARGIYRARFIYIRQRAATPVGMTAMAKYGE